MAPLPTPAATRRLALANNGITITETAATMVSGMLRFGDRRPNLSSGNLLQIEASDDDCRLDGVHALSRFFGGVDALRTHQQVLFKDAEFGFVLHQSKVEAFKIVVRDVVHALIVDGAAKSSQKK
jgi:hypothetical protein